MLQPGQAFVCSGVLTAQKPRKMTGFDSMHNFVYNDPPPEQLHLSTIVEFGGLSVLVLAILCGIAWSTRLRRLSKLERAVARPLGPRSIVVLCGAFGFLATMCVGVFVHMPQPRIHDEYSYLLAADTFAHGRLTNPTHPLWKHFETIHELQRPSYASKYPPGQGMILALGEVLGNPAIGLWIAAGLASAAVAWMLLAFYPRRWALLGGLLTALHPMVLKWTQNYWGGLVAMVGGALLIGAMRRLAEPAGGVVRRRDAAVMAVGIAVLLNSRPWEGGLLTLLVLVRLWQCLRRNPPSMRAVMRRIAVPAALVLAFTFAWMGYYNWRVTGRPLRMPYVEHEAQYWVAPTLMFLPIRPIPPTLTAESMRAVAVTWAVRSYRKQHTPLGFLDAGARKLLANVRGAFLLFDMSADDLDPPTRLPWWLLGFRWLLLIPLAAALCRGRVDPWLRWSIGCAGLFSLLLLTDTWMHPHYAAPAAGVIAIILVGGLRSLNAWAWRGRRIGHGLTRLLALCFAASLAAACVQFRSPEWVRGNGSAREVMIDYLKRQSSHNLVLVRYGEGYQVNGEWLYNDADIDDSPIVWARELDPRSNSELLGYFRNRRPWLLLLDRTGAHLYPITVTRN